MSRQQVISKGSHRLLGPQPVQQWSSLVHGDRVEIWSADSFLYAADVDDRSDDGQVVWVIEIGTGSRRLFLSGDLVTLYPV